MTTTHDQILKTYILKHPAFLWPQVRREAKYFWGKIVEQYAWSTIVEWDDAFCYRYNINTRLCTAVYLQVWHREKITDFDVLFDAISSLDRKQYITPWHGLSIKTASYKHPLYAERTVQSVSHKAVLHSLGWTWMRYSEWEKSIVVFVNLDPQGCTVAVNTSWASLHRREYIIDTWSAHLKENLAAWLVLASGRRHTKALYDPFCGTGTIAIEAAMIAKNIAPWRNKTFAYQSFTEYDKALDDQVRQTAKEKEYTSHDYAIFSSDNNSRVIETAKAHAERAWVSDLIHFTTTDIHNLKVSEDSYIVTNPPYGERLMAEEIPVLDSLYKRLVSLYETNNAKGAFITSHELSLDSRKRKWENRRNWPLFIKKRSIKG